MSNVMHSVLALSRVPIETGSAIFPRALTGLSPKTSSGTSAGSSRCEDDICRAAIVHQDLPYLPTSNDSLDYHRIVMRGCLDLEVFFCERNWHVCPLWLR